MIEPTIHSIFPTPIYTTKINRGFTKEELQFVNEQKKHCKKNAGNIYTKDNYILNQKEFKNIKKFLNEHCTNYLNTIICSKNNLELYITQSWLNYTETNQYHHKHEHPNSVISGVLYFDSDIKNDKILFSHPVTYKQISPETDKTKFNLWNSNTWFFPVETGNLFMFPSSITHQVETKKGNNTRISLSFNTFYKGILGSNNQLTELIL
tara:strand:+ start:596 stop:1219 length:624 start_codon:yes stop_codon:yes gene_type:complete